jgi:hypothetical protein
MNNNLRTHYYYRVTLSPNTPMIDGEWFEIQYEGEKKRVKTYVFEFSSGYNSITYEEALKRLEGTEFNTIEGIFVVDLKLKK